MKLKNTGTVYKKTAAFLVCAMLLTGTGGTAAQQFFQNLLPAVIEVSAAEEDAYDLMRMRWAETLQGSDAAADDQTSQEIIRERVDEAFDQWQNMEKSTGRTYLFKGYPELYNRTAHMTSSYMLLQKMAIACKMGGGQYLDERLQQVGSTLEQFKADLISALDFMYETCYNETRPYYPSLQSDTFNWWDFEIGSPQQLNDIVVLLYDDLTPEQIEKYMAAVEHFMPDPEKYYFNTGTSTGSNRTNVALVTALHGIITKNDVRISSARGALDIVLQYVATGDGFYTDGSFIQHGNLPYTGGYGLGLLQSLSGMAYLFEGTAYRIDDPQIGNLYTWMYKSFEPFVNSGMMMDAVNGRQISRSYNKGNSATMLISSAIMLSLTAPEPLAADLRSMAKTWAMDEVADRQWRTWNQRPTLFIWNQMCELTADASIPMWETKTEYRQFASMDRPLYRQPSYSFSIAMSSSRIANYENTNGENMQGWHTADGMTYLYNADDTAYTDAFWATVDPYRLPGITVVAEESMQGGASGRGCISESKRAADRRRTA